MVAWCTAQWAGSTRFQHPLHLHLESDIFLHFACIFHCDSSPQCSYQCYLCSSLSPAAIDCFHSEWLESPCLDNMSDYIMVSSDRIMSSSYLILTHILSLIFSSLWLMQRIFVVPGCGVQIQVKERASKVGWSGYSHIEGKLHGLWFIYWGGNCFMVQILWLSYVGN